MLIYEDKMVQTAREHELWILWQPDIHLWQLAESCTYLQSETPVEESYDLRVQLTFLEQSVKCVVFPLMAHWKAALSIRIVDNPVH
jgi:hypothetical protein